MRQVEGALEHRAGLTELDVDCVKAGSVEHATQRSIRVHALWCSRDVVTKVHDTMRLLHDVSIENLDSLLASSTGVRPNTIHECSITSRRAALDVKINATSVTTVNVKLRHILKRLEEIGEFESRTRQAQHFRKVGSNSSLQGTNSRLYLLELGLAHPN